MSLPLPTVDMPDLFESDDEQPEETEELQDPFEEAMLELIDEITLGLCFEVHRACKFGTFMLGETDKQAEQQFCLIEERGLDVFGQVPTKKQFECVCPNCNRTIAASRFAPHLEKCMGMGRNSSRIASRRIANANAKKDSDNDSEQDDDNDWSYTADRKVKKLKKDKANHSGSPRRGKNSKHRNNGGDIPSVGSTKSDDSGHVAAPYENMTLDERKALLLSTCGVISEHTKKMCTRSGRCPQHSDEQRRIVRQFLLGHEQDDVDIDTYDDTDSQSLRESLQWEATSNPSPADSTSSISKKRKHGKAGKKKSKPSSSASNSRGGTPTGSVLMGYLVSK